MIGLKYGSRCNTEWTECMLYTVMTRRGHFDPGGEKVYGKENIMRSIKIVNTSKLRLQYTCNNICIPI